jgi:dynein light chain roadblock-type
VRELDCTNDLVFLRIKTKKYEIMVAYDKDFYLIVHSTFEKKEEEKE